MVIFYILFGVVSVINLLLLCLLYSDNRKIVANMEYNKQHFDDKLQDIANQSLDYIYDMIKNDVAEEVETININDLKMTEVDESIYKSKCLNSGLEQTRTDSEGNDFIVEEVD